MPAPRNYDARRGDRDRDAQPVYRAERDALGIGGPVPVPGFSNLREAQLFVNRITDSDYWKQRYPGVPHLVLRPSRTGKGASLDQINIIKLPASGLNPGYILHELAHSGTDVRYGVQGIGGHGPQWRYEMAGLVAQFMGVPQATALIKAFVARGLPWVSYKDHEAPATPMVAKQILDRRQHWQGEIHRVWNQYTRGEVALIDTQASSKPDMVNRWLVVCAMHKKGHRVETKTDATDLLPTPWDFCKACREAFTPWRLENIRADMMRRRAAAAERRAERRAANAIR